MESLEELGNGGIGGGKERSWVTEKEWWILGKKVWEVLGKGFWGEGLSGGMVEGPSHGEVVDVEGQDVRGGEN